MPELQESQLTRDVSTEPTATETCEGFQPVAGEIALERTDWFDPVGYFKGLEFERVESVVREMRFEWVRVRIDEFHLGHRATLLLLQGERLSSILIPNHHVQMPGRPDVVVQVGHVLLRVAPWEYWAGVRGPILRDLVIAKLGEIPRGLGSTEVLAALAQDSAA